MAKGFSLSLSGALLEQVTAHANQGGMSLQDATRELVLLGLSVAPQDTVIQNAKQRAYDDTRRYVASKYAELVTLLSKDLEKTLGLQIWGSTPPKHGG